MDKGTTDDYIADLMMEAAVARASLEWMTMERDRLMRLIKLFASHYECNDCDRTCDCAMCIEEVETCMNPLHALHDAVEGLGDRNE